jgi:multisubunit Na+/H+ antiporter MnhG subunit
MEHEIDQDFEKLSPTDEDVVSSSSAVAAEHRGNVEDLSGAGSSEGLSSHIPVPFKSTSEGVDELGHGAKSSQSSSSPARTMEKTSVCTSCCSMMENIDPRVMDLLMWRDIKKSGTVLASAVILLLALSLFSALSVVAYFGVVVLTITTSFRLYCSAMTMMNKSTDGAAPFKKYLECELTIPQEKVHHQADIVVKHVTKLAEHLRRLFLVENVVDSVKFGLILWLLTYVGGWFNGLTLVLLATIGLFTLPKVYDTYKVQIDHFVHLAWTKISEIWKKVEDKVPMLAKKKQA